MRTFLEDSLVEFLLRAICSDFMGINFSSCSCLKSPRLWEKIKTFPAYTRLINSFFLQSRKPPKNWGWLTYDKIMRHYKTSLSLDFTDWIATKFAPVIPRSSRKSAWDRRNSRPSMHTASFATWNALSVRTHTRHMCDLTRYILSVTFI